MDEYRQAYEKAKSKRWKKGYKRYWQLTVFAAVFGAVFLSGEIVFYRQAEMNFHLYFGAVLLVISAAVLGWIVFTRRKKRYLLNEGQQVYAEILTVEVGTIRIRRNTENVYYVICRQQNDSRIFRSQPMDYDPARYIELANIEELPVYLDWVGGKDYYVDTFPIDWASGAAL